MHAVIPAAGDGSRLRPPTADRPEGLAEVAGKPLHPHCLKALLACPVEAFVAVVGHAGNQIVERGGDSVGDVLSTYA